MPALKIFALFAAAFLFGCISQPVEQAQQENVQMTANTAQIANPSATFCMERGHDYKIRKAADGSEAGVCVFANGNECDGWGYFRNECNENGTVKTGARQGEFCGGIAGIPCADGLSCKLSATYPDAGGICEKLRASSGFFPCSSNRTETCTMEYAPVCGRSGETESAYDYEDYSTGCVACSKGSKATGYFAGTCGQNGLAHKALDTAKLYDCPSARFIECNSTIDPVCGRIVSPVSEAGYFSDFQNPCEACSASSNAIGYYVGNCGGRNLK